MPIKASLELRYKSEQNIAPLDLIIVSFFFVKHDILHTCVMMMIAFITFKSSLVPLLEGL